MGKRRPENYKLESKATLSDKKFRERLYELFNSRPMPDEELMLNLGLYMRSSMVAKFLFLNEAYNMIKDIPGVIMEFGIWWGQNLVFFENLRAVYEPFNQTRRVIGFDTFKGYTGISKQDKASETIKAGGYAVSENYQSYLDELIDFHEKNNVLKGVKKHETVAGDVSVSLPRYLKSNPEIVVALAYIDLAIYEPIKTCLTALRPHLIPGSVIVMDEFNNPDYPGATKAFREAFSEVEFEATRSQFMADRAFIKVKRA
jgi:hypothetical protein